MSKCKRHYNIGKQNPNYGKHPSEECRRKNIERLIGNKFGRFNAGDKNGMWKGDNVTYQALHAWVRRNKPRPELCQNCNLKPPLDVANITGTYTKDFDNWSFMCRSCHMKLDYVTGKRIWYRNAL